MIRLSIHEVMAASSCILFVQDKPIIASIFLTLATLGSISRAALEMNDRKEQIKKQEEAYESVSLIGRGLVDILTKIPENLNKK